MGLYTNLQRGVLPNIYPLKKLIGWVDAVSDFLDAFPTTPQVVAMAKVDPAGTIVQNFGFSTPALHPGTGQFALNLINTSYNINDLIPFANITNVSTPNGALNIYPFMNSNSQVFVYLWQIAVTTAARTAIDQDFMVMILKKP